MTMNLTDRITVNPQQCGGRPCIRRMRIRVIDVLDLLTGGMATGAKTRFSADVRLLLLGLYTGRSIGLSQEVGCCGFGGASLPLIRA